MGKIQETVETFLTSIGWRFERHAERSSLATVVSGDNGQFTAFVDINEVNHQLVCYAICPVVCPLDKRTAMAELITRANYGLILGNLEMDFEDGEVRYKTSADVEDVDFQPAACQAIIYPSVVQLDRFLPAVMGVIYGDKTPKVLLETLAAANRIDLP